jgi:hypothetical protein
MAAPAKSAKKDFDAVQLAKDLLAGGISGSFSTLFLSVCRLALFSALRVFCPP